MLGIHFMQEGQEGSSTLWHTIVWPSCELELDDHPRIHTILFHMLWKREQRTGGWGGGS